MALATNGWSMLVLRGAASLVFGLLALASPRVAVTALVFLFGIYALVDGVTSGLFALSARRARTTDQRRARARDLDDDSGPRHASVTVLGSNRAPTWYLVRGLFGVGAGIVAFLYPGLTAMAFAILVGVWAIGAGVTELVLAQRLHHVVPRVAGLVVAGVVTLSFGIALLMAPLVGVFALGGMVAFLAILSGVASISIASRLHDDLRTVHV